MTAPANSPEIISDVRQPKLPISCPTSGEMTMPASESPIAPMVSARPRRASNQRTISTDSGRPTALEPAVRTSPTMIPENSAEVDMPSARKLPVTMNPPTVIIRRSEMRSANQPAIGAKMAAPRFMKMIARFMSARDSPSSLETGTT